jgi:recombination DNA repair RAD52 pathway protein
LGNSHDGHATFTSMQKSKKFGDAFDIAYKGSVSDATKRALRKFGNALGNCLYSEKYRSEYKMHLARKGAKKKAAVAAKLRELAQKRLEKQQLNTTTTRISNSCSSNSRKRPIELTTPKDMSSSSKIQKTSSAPTEKEDTAVSTSQQQREVECTVDVAEETKEEKDEGESILTTDDAFEIEGELVFENDDYDDGVRWSQVETQ